MKYLILVLALALAGCTHWECTPYTDKKEAWDEFVRLCYANADHRMDLGTCMYRATKMGYGECVQVAK